MKAAKLLLSLLICFALSIAANAQNEPGVDSTGLPGDNFSLQGALEMFQKASSPEDFEKLINAEDNHVNNLDLNNDGQIDYIRVIDKSDRDVHAFILQVPVSETENQDIAVIELEKTGDTTAVLQIVGDEDIYGEQVIIEPASGESDEGAFNYNSIEDKARGSNAGYSFDYPRIIVNVWFWPSVRFVYAPLYRPWVSPWRWRHYPNWWRSWRPLTWHVFHPFHRHYHNRFVVVRTHRVMHAHRIYTPGRMTSVSVRTRHATTVNGYRVTRSKTTITGPRGNKATRTRTTVTGPRGNKGTKTTVRKHR